MAAKSHTGVLAAARQAARLMDMATGETAPVAGTGSLTGALVPFPWDRRVRAAARAEGPIPASSETLADIALRVGPARARTTEAYHMFFAALRDRPVVLCEIGAAAGEAAALWQGYFLRGAVTCVAPEDVGGLPGDLAPDIVIDDGSRPCAEVQARFLSLFPRLKAGGFYIIENLHGSGTDDLVPGVARTADLFRSYAKKRRFATGDAGADAAFAALAPQFSGVLMLVARDCRSRRDQVAVVHKR